VGAMLRCVRTFEFFRCVVEKPLANSTVWRDRLLRSYPDGCTHVVWQSVPRDELCSAARNYASGFAHVQPDEGDWVIR